jgi:hypothetical protein
VCVVVGFKFCWWNITDFGVESPVVEPDDVGHGLGFEVFGGTPRATPFRELRLVQCVDCLGHRVVIRIANRPDRRLGPDLSETLSVHNTCILRPGIGMCDHTADQCCFPRPNGMLQRIHDKAGSHRG